MKKYTFGTFVSREDAEKAINHLHREVSIPTEEISYIYRNTEGEVKEVDADKVSSGTPAEAATTGAEVGGVIGGLGGLAVVAGVIPAVGPIFAAGPLLTALGIGGAVGTTAAGAVGGAAVGGLIGALVNLGVTKERAQEYEDRVMAGDILVAVHTEDDEAVREGLVKHNAANIDTYQPTV